jgi:hypothetical protein
MYFFLGPCGIGSSDDVDILIWGNSYSFLIQDQDTFTNQARNKFNKYILLYPLFKVLIDKSLFLNGPMNFIMH